MTALLCLLSGQHVPNLLAVHHYRPERLVLIESAAMKQNKAAEHFLAALRIGGLNYDSRCDVIPLAAEDNLQAIRKALAEAYGKHTSADWTANLIGGTKPMSIATYEFFKALNGRLIYTNLRRPAEIMNLVTTDTEQCRHELTIKEFLAGYGFESRKADAKILEAEDRAKRWRGCARVIASNATSDDLLRLSDEDRKKARDKGLTLGPDRLNLLGSSPVRDSLISEFWDGEVRQQKLDRHAVEFLTGGWLEVFLWNLLETHAKALGIWDVRLGLEVGRIGDTLGNDFDVAFMRNYELSMIECKSGAQEHDSGGDVLYKVEAVIRQFRAKRVRAFLVSTAPNILDKEGQVKSSLKTRSAIYNCRILTGMDVRDMADDPDDADLVRQQFFG